jgi:hypothetical protein
MQRGLLNTGGPTILQFPESEYVHLYLAPSWVPDAGSYFKLSSINVSLGNIYFKFCTLAVIYAWFASSTLFSPLPTNISQSMKFTLQQVFFWKCLWLYSFFYTSNECLLILEFLILMNHLTLFWHSNWPKCWALRILYYYYPTMFFCILSLTTQGYNFEIFCYVFFMSWWDICCWLYMFVSFFLLLWQIPNSSRLVLAGWSLDWKVILIYLKLWSVKQVFPQWRYYTFWFRYECGLQIDIVDYFVLDIRLLTILCLISVCCIDFCIVYSEISMQKTGKK